MPDIAPGATAALGPDGFPLNPISVGAAAPSAPPVAAAPVPAAPAVPEPAAPPVTRFLNDRSRVKTVALDWPVEVDGVAYREVVVRRLTAGEVGAFVDRVRASGSGAEVRFPLFYDAAGTPIPDRAWDAFDSDDADKLVEAGDDFLPARFRTVRTADASGPGNAATTGPSSPTSQATASTS